MGPSREQGSGDCPPDPKATHEARWGGSSLWERQRETPICRIFFPFSEREIIEKNWVSNKE